MIELFPAQRKSVIASLSADALSVSLIQFYGRKYFIRAARGISGSPTLEAETRDLVDTTARFVDRMDDEFRVKLREKIETSFPISADERQKAMGLSYVSADVELLTSLVCELVRPEQPRDREARAIQVASNSVEQLLCGTRVIRKLCNELGLDDPEGVAAAIDTKALQQAVAELLVADVKRAAAR